MPVSRGEAGLSPDSHEVGFGAEGADRRPGAPNVNPGFGAEGADRRPGAPNVNLGFGAEGADRRPGAPNVNLGALPPAIHVPPPGPMSRAAAERLEAVELSLIHI